MLENFNTPAFVTEISNLAARFIPHLILSIVVLIIGMAVISRFVRGVHRLMTKRKVDPSLVPFLTGMLRAVLIIILVVSVAGMVGIQTTSFVAVLGAAGLAVGLALQGSLSNFAGGVLILLMKPFKVGDVIEAQGSTATVTEIQIFHTVMRTFDNKIVIIPNGVLYNNKIINYSVEPTRVVEWIFSISYHDDIDKARKIIQDIVYTDDRVIAKDEHYIKLSELANSSVNLKVRAKVNQPDYWNVFFDVNEQVKKTFDSQGITIPFPQVDAHVYSSRQV